jgi:hypothetical protein
VLTSSWLTCRLYLRGPSQRGVERARAHEMYTEANQVASLLQFDVATEAGVSAERLSEFISYFESREAFVIAASANNLVFRFDHYVDNECVRILLCGFEVPGVWTEVDGEPEAWEHDGIFAERATLRAELLDVAISAADRILLRRVLDEEQPCVGTGWPPIDARRAALAAARQHRLPLDWSTAAGTNVPGVR